MATHRGLKRTAAMMAASIVIGLGTAGAARAHGTSVPYHLPVQAACAYPGVNEVHSRPPADMRSWYGGMENVRWSSDLFRWNGTSWALYNGSKPWLYSAANRNGLQSTDGYAIWYHSVTRFSADQGFVYRSLRRGYYAVREHLRWVDVGVTHSQWSTFLITNQDICRIAY